MALYLRLGTCYEVNIKLACSSSVHKYTISILSHLSDFVKCGSSFNFSVGSLSQLGNMQESSY